MYSPKGINISVALLVGGLAIAVLTRWNWGGGLRIQLGTVRDMTSIFCRPISARTC